MQTTVLRRITAVSLITLMCTTSPLAVRVVMAQETQPGDACTAGETGYLRYAGDDTPGPAVTGENFMFCDGANWVGFLNYDDANTTVTLGQNTHFIGSGQALPAAFDDNGTRLFFYVDKKAFRGGEITGGNTAWADANIGSGSFAWGTNPKAAGSGSVAMGKNTVTDPTRRYSVALGSTATSSATYSFASGKALVSGSYAVAMGVAAVSANRYDFTTGNSRAYGRYSVALGSSTGGGRYSVALGGATTAGRHNLAVGDVVMTGGYAALALGSQVIVGDGLFIGGNPDNGALDTTIGEGSMGFGLQTAAQTTDPKITGDRTIAFFFDGNTVDANSGVDVTANDSFIIYGGKMGIGTISPNVELDVTGDIEYTGTIADVSDRRLKTEITNLPAGQLSKISSLQGVSFKMKDDPKGQTEFGFIAQDVQLYYPELVYESGGGMLSMNYIGLIAPMIEAIEEQNDIIKEQRAVIEELTKNIEALENGP